MSFLLAMAVEIGILGLFQPRLVVLHAQPGQVVTVRSAQGETLQLAAGQPLKMERSGDSISWTAQGRRHAASSLTASGRFELRVADDFRRGYEGRLRITPVGSHLQLVLEAEIEDAVARTIAAESPALAPPQALQAQAILARTFLRAAAAPSGARHKEFHVCDTTHCQVLKEAAPASRAAAGATEGLLLKYQGRLFSPAYSASCGGRTRTAAEIGWREPEPGGAGNYPYFAVDCLPCRRSAPTWERTFHGYDAASIREHPQDEAMRLQIGRRLGWQSLPSNTYELIEAAGGLLLRGRGQGHGLGYCQQGGATMARGDRSAAQILGHYFPGTSVSR